MSLTWGRTHPAPEEWGEGARAWLCSWEGDSYQD